MGWGSGRTSSCGPMMPSREQAEETTQVRFTNDIVVEDAVLDLGSEFAPYLDAVIAAVDHNFSPEEFMETIVFVKSEHATQLRALAKRLMESPETTVAMDVDERSTVRPVRSQMSRRSQASRLMNLPSAEYCGSETSESHALNETDDVDRAGMKEVPLQVRFDERFV